MTLWKRILVEKRVAIIPLALVLLANIAAYALWVYPLGVKSAGAADRAAAAARAVQAADQELAAARRLTFATLPNLAHKSNVKFLDRRVDNELPDREKNARLGVLRVHTQFQGEYESLRRFIYQLESDPAFVIIDDVQLAQSDPAKPLTLVLQLSTYYRLGTNGN